MSRNLKFAEGEYYHIYNRGVEKRKIFMDKGDHERFVRLLYSANSDTSVHLSNYQGFALLEMKRGESIVAVGAWALMPNHFHLLLKEVKENGISEYLHKVLTGYSMYFNIKYHRKGSLFAGAFNAKHLDTDEYLKYQYAYIHLNPIGIIDNGWKNKKIRDQNYAKKFLSSYKYSSLKDYSGENREEKSIIDPSMFPEYFKSSVDFEDMLKEWMGFENIKANIKAKP